MRVLSIDHINGDGLKHIRQFRWTGQYYDWLLKEKRDGFQVLCMNCQWIKRRTNNENSKARHLKKNKTGV